MGRLAGNPRESLVSCASLWSAAFPLPRHSITTAITGTPHLGALGFIFSSSSSQLSGRIRGLSVMDGWRTAAKIGRRGEMAHTNPAGVCRTYLPPLTDPHCIFPSHTFTARESPRTYTGKVSRKIRAREFVAPVWLRWSPGFVREQRGAEEGFSLCLINGKTGLAGKHCGLSSWMREGSNRAQSKNRADCSSATQPSPLLSLSLWMGRGRSTGQAKENSTQCTIN